LKNQQNEIMLKVNVGNGLQREKMCVFQSLNAGQNHYVTIANKYLQVCGHYNKQ